MIALGAPAPTPLTCATATDSFPLSLSLFLTQLVPLVLDFSSVVERPLLTLVLQELSSPTPLSEPSSGGASSLLLRTSRPTTSLTLALRSFFSMMQSLGEMLCYAPIAGG